MKEEPVRAAATLKGIQVLQDDVQGRFCLAAQEFEAGAVVYGCAALASALEPEERSKRCSCCLCAAPEVTLRPCDGCNGEYAVCSLCSELEEQQHKQQECQLLAKLSGCPSSVLLALRLHTSTAAPPTAVTLDDLRECTAEGAAAAASAQEEAAQILAAVLPPPATDASGGTDAAPLAAARHALALCANNAHAIMDPTSHTVIGQGVWPPLSLFNHACSPSLYFSVDTVPRRGATAAVRARHALRCGDPLTLSYIPLLATPRDARQAALAEKYGFQCGCAECSAADGGLDALLCGLSPAAPPPPADDSAADATASSEDGGGGGAESAAVDGEQLADVGAIEEAETLGMVEECEALAAAGNLLEAHLILETQRTSLRALGPSHTARVRLLLALTHVQTQRGGVAAAAPLAATCAALLRAARPVAALVDPMLLVQTLVYRAMALRQAARDGGEDCGDDGGGSAEECLREAQAILTTNLGRQHAYTQTVGRMLQEVEGGGEEEEEPRRKAAQRSDGGGEADTQC